MDACTKDIISCLQTISRFSKGKRPLHKFAGDLMDMTVAQLDLMAYLYEHKKAKMSELARHAGVKLPSMTDTINKLVSLGMLKRERDEADRRTVWVSITKHVEKAVFKHIKEHDESISRMMRVLTPEEKRQAASILRKLTDNILKTLEERAK